MSTKVKDVLCAPLLRFDTIDSTNNYAAQLIDADKSVPGLTILAARQTAGKGQRSNTWSDEQGQALLMSIILQPEVAVEDQFSFSAAVAVSVATVLLSLDARIDVRVKFPNDIIINDKKAAGILIENIFRGSKWTHAIVGIGLNVNQAGFFPELPHATSIYLATGRKEDIDTLMLETRKAVIENTSGRNLMPALYAYNKFLYKKGSIQQFSEGNTVFEAEIEKVNPDGRLLLRHPNGETKSYAHGDLKWIW